MFKSHFSGSARVWREKRLTSPEAKGHLHQPGLLCALSPPLQLGSTRSLLSPNPLLFFPCSSLIKPSVRSASPPTRTSSTPCFHIFFVLPQTQETLVSRVSKLPEDGVGMEPSLGSGKTRSPSACPPPGLDFRARRDCCQRAKGAQG